MRFCPHPITTERPQLKGSGVIKRNTNIDQMVSLCGPYSRSKFVLGYADVSRIYSKTGLIECWLFGDGRSTPLPKNVPVQEKLTGLNPGYHNPRLVCWIRLSYFLGALRRLLKKSDAVMCSSAAVIAEARKMVRAQR